MTTYLSIPNTKDEKEKEITTKTLLYSLVLISPFLLGGITMAYPAIALPQMKLDISDASWFGSIHALLSPVGAFLVGISIDKYGRRPALLLTVVPSTVGWFLLCTSTKTVFILLAQILNGITFGAIGYPSQVYAGECIMVRHVHLRNYFATWTGMTTSLGTFITFLLGYFLHHQQIATIAATLSTLSFLSIYAFIPESPTWLHLQGRVDDAERSQSKLGIRRQPMPPPQIPSMAEEFNSTGRRRSVTWTSWRVPASLTKITRKDVYKPLIIMTVTFVMIFMAGGLTITTYMVQVLQLHPADGVELATACTINGTTLGADAAAAVDEFAYKYSAISGGLIFVANFGASMAAMRVGVNALTKFALFWAAIGLASMGYSRMRAECGRAFWSTVHVWSVWLVAFMFNFGPVNVTWGTLGDVFPTDGKGFASVCVTIAAVTMALSNKLYPYMVSTYGGALYYGYAIVILVASVFCHFFLPETVGKTLDQINRNFF